MGSLLLGAKLTREEDVSLVKESIAFIRLQV